MEAQPIVQRLIFLIVGSGALTGQITPESDFYFL